MNGRYFAMQNETSGIVLPCSSQSGSLGKIIQVASKQRKFNPYQEKNGDHRYITWQISKPRYQILGKDSAAIQAVWQESPKRRMCENKLISPLCDSWSYKATSLIYYVTSLYCDCHLVDPEWTQVSRNSCQQDSDLWWNPMYQRLLKWQSIKLHARLVWPRRVAGQCENTAN